MIFHIQGIKYIGLYDQKKIYNEHNLVFFSERDFGRPWHTYEAFQKFIKQQVKSLIKLGADPALKVRKRW